VEGLATLFVTLVLIANNIAPNSNFPKRLGVTLQTGVLSEETATDSASPGSTPSGETFREEKETRRNALEEARRANKESLQRIREERKRSLELAKTEREQFKERLQELRDEKKREVVERIDQNIGKHNEKWIEHWNKVLSRLTEILAKIKTRTDKAAGEGKDVTAVNSATAAADAAIAAAQSAIDAQAGKTYVIEITDEEHLGENVSEVVRGFKTDVKAVVEKVQAAKKAVQNAFKALKVIIKPEEEEASPSPTP